MGHKALRNNLTFHLYWILLANRIGTASSIRIERKGHLHAYSFQPKPKETCKPEEKQIRLPSPTGRLEWTDSAEHCISVWRWVVDSKAPAGRGIVLDIHHLRTALDDQVRVYDTTRADRPRLVRTVRSTAPVLIYGSRAVIKAATGRVYKRSLYSSFNITVSTHSLRSMPRPAIPQFGNIAETVSSKYVYNCSSPSVQIPSALMCDNVAQCAAHEDEVSCDYRDAGCGDGVPYRNQCLRFVFWKYNDPQVTTLHKLMEYSHRAVERACRNTYQSTLFSMPYDRDLEFVRDVVMRSGFQKVHHGLRKFRRSSQNRQTLYRFLWQWGGRGGTVAYDQTPVQRVGYLQDCSVFTAYPNTKVEPVHCVLGKVFPSGYVCSKTNYQRQLSAKAPRTVSLAPAAVTFDSFPTKRCVDKSLTHPFHPCLEHQAEATPGRDGTGPDEATSGRAGSSASRDGHPTTGLPPFRCQYGPGVHYTLVCDGFKDCVDGEDEAMCERPRRSLLLVASFVCQRTQVIPASKRCNGFLDCLDGSDEEGCASCEGSLALCPLIGCLPEQYWPFVSTCSKMVHVRFRKGPSSFNISKNSVGVVSLDGFGMSRIDPFEEPGVCPETHFRCHGGMCIPSFLVNNEEQDCRQGEDENIRKENFTCPGFFRCYLAWNCVHPSHVCDGIPHCPNRDDELYCNLSCPGVCTCEGHAYTCRDTFNVSEHLHVRYLDVSGVNNPSMADLRHAEYLHFLNLSFCQLTNVTLQGFVHLHVLDLRHNYLLSVSSAALRGLKNLLHLDLSHNPLARRLDSAFDTFLSTAGCVKLQTLDMINNSLGRMEREVFAAVPELVSLDLRSNEVVDFDLDVFRGLDELRVLRTDISKLCCSLPVSSSSRCQAPVDELSSCSDLLRSDFFRVFMWALSLLALTGNIGVLVYRLFLEKVGSAHGYRMLVIHLCVSDLLMGVYLFMIGVADSQYRGHYVVQDTAWRHSSACKLAGFLALLSCEVSAFMLCLITADRVLMLCFPFHTKLHMTRLSATLYSCLAWGAGVVLAVTPLLPPTSHWNFYSQTGICIPLPVTRNRFPGQGYAFTIFIVLNFVNFVFIGCGQMVVLRAVRQTSAAVSTQRKQHDLTVARRLFVVVFSDFCCWFPVGLMGLLAAGGVPIPGVVNVWVVVFVLPLNSALNPFLYTLRATLDKWRALREETRMRKIVKNLQVQIDRDGEGKAARERRWAPPLQCWPERSEVSNASLPYD